MITTVRVTEFRKSMRYMRRLHTFAVYRGLKCSMVYLDRYLKAVNDSERLLLRAKVSGRR